MHYCALRALYPLVMPVMDSLLEIILNVLYVLNHLLGRTLCKTSMSYQSSITKEKSPHQTTLKSCFAKLLTDLLTKIVTYSEKNGISQFSNFTKFNDLYIVHRLSSPHHPIFVNKVSHTNQHNIDPTCVHETIHYKGTASISYTLICTYTYPQKFCTILVS